MTNPDPYATEPAVVLLVRHGRTALNAEGRLRGHADPDLDDVGRAEAKATAAALRHYKVARVLTSPLGRAVETGAAIAHVSHAPAAPDMAFIDRDYGPWTAHLTSEVIRDWGSVDDAPGVEDSGALFRRAWDGLNRCAMPGRAVAVVTHDAVIRALLPAIKRGVDPVVGTASWAVLVRDRDGWRVRSFDNTAGRATEAPAGPEEPPVVMRCAVAVMRPGEILLLHRTDRDDWVLPGGNPRSSESMVACARREVREETGLIVDPDRCAFVLEVTAPERHRRLVELVFAARVTQRGELVAERPTSVPVWVPIDDLPGIKLRPPINGYLPALAAGNRDTAPYLGNLWRPDQLGDWDGD